MLLVDAIRESDGWGMHVTLVGCPLDDVYPRPRKVYFSSSYPRWERDRGKRPIKTLRGVLFGFHEGQTNLSMGRGPSVWDNPPPLGPSGATGWSSLADGRSCAPPPLSSRPATLRAFDFIGHEHFLTEAELLSLESVEHDWNDRP